jgi:hypothetical protein
MAEINLGRIKPIWKGAYSAAVVYKPLDFISYLGSPYFCILETTAGILPTNATYFQLVSSPLLAAAITDGDTTHAPDGNSVYDALALKANLNSPVFTGSPEMPTLKLTTGAGAGKVPVSDADGDLTLTDLAAGLPIATAAGTVDAITANYSPDIALADMTIIAFVASGANTSATPTFAPDGLTAHTIVKHGGAALVAGDIPGEHAVCIMEYNLTHTRWELLNPAAAGGGTTFASSAEVLAGSEAAKAVAPDTLKTALDLKANITPSYYGVSWDESADTYARTGDNAGLLVGVTLGNTRLPIQANMKRCLLADDGTVNHYLDPTNSALLAEGGNATLDGSDGQVMVQIPKFWHKHTYVGTVHTWEVSTVARTGFAVHPAFLSGATEYDYIYVGAYEAILWDATTSTYIDYAAGATIDHDNDKLSSVTAKKPVTNITRHYGRVMAAKRGTGWSQELYDYRSAVQLLYLTEYASFNSQAKIGAGISNVTDWANISYYPFAPSGNSNSIGNATGNTAGGTGYAAEASKYMSYRGIEHFYGHIYKWMDGLNVYESGGNHRAYVCNVLANLNDDTTTNYTDTGINCKADDGYQNTLINIDRGFLPAVGTDADAATKITDYYYQTTGWAVARSGGSASYGADDGVFCLSVVNASSSSNAAIGSRVCFR